MLKKEKVKYLLLIYEVISIIHLSSTFLSEAWAPKSSSEVGGQAEEDNTW